MRNRRASVVADIPTELIKEPDHVERSPSGSCRSDSNTSSTQLGPDHRGRPCFDICHTHSKASPTSVLSHSNKNVNLRGCLNLLILIVIAQNAYLVIENFTKYGVLIKPVIPAGISDVVNNWPILLSLILMHGSFFMAFAIEKWLNPIIIRQSDERGFTFLSILICLVNGITLLLIPYATVSIYDVEPLSATGLLAFSITWAMKVVSFHHTLADVRSTLARHESFDGVLGGDKCALYPASLNVFEFYTFLLMPTLCYQFEYPRTPRIQWHSLLAHLVELGACFIFIKILVEQYIVMTVHNTFLSPEKLMQMSSAQILVHVFNRLLKLSVPNLYLWLLLFLALFHHWLNILAEITRFGDRNFYQDWWNASGFDEYWRKWNVPIHNFFNRHLNKPMRRAGFDKIVSACLIFAISALAHEYMVCTALRLGWNGIVIGAFLGQVPMMYLTSAKLFRVYPTIGNMFFWITFCFSGQPLAILVYYYLWGVQFGGLPQVDMQKLVNK